MKTKHLWNVILLGVCMIGSAARARSQDPQFIDDWTKMAGTPGAAVTFKELGRNRADGHSMVTYNIFVTGLPKDKQYTLWVWQLGHAEPEAVTDALIGGDGKIVSRLADSAHKVTEDPINIRAFVGRGEAKRFALTSADWKDQVFGDVVPFPLDTASAGCQLSVTTFSPDYSTVVVRGSGFQPNEPLTMQSTSAGENGTSSVAASASGTTNTVLLPVAKGKSSGVCSFSITGAKCHVAIQFPWGAGSYKLQ